MSVFNVCFVVNSTGGLVPLYKGKGDVHECSNFRGIRFLSGRKNVW